MKAAHMSEGEVFNQNKELMEPWTPGQLFFINCTEEQSMDSLSYCCLYFCLHTPKKKEAKAPGGGGGSTRL